MTKSGPIGIRLAASERAALEKAAGADDRSLSAMARKIIADWLRKGGYLEAGPARTEKRRTKA